MQSFQQHSSYNMHHAHSGMKMSPVPLGYGMHQPDSPSILNHASQAPSYPPIQPTVPSQNMGSLAYSSQYQAYEYPARATFHQSEG